MGLLRKGIVDERIISVCIRSIVYLRVIYPSVKKNTHGIEVVDDNRSVGAWPL